MKRALIVLALITMALFLFTGAISCSNTSKYKKATVTREGVTFSFEYPASYEDPYMPLSENETTVTLREIDDVTNIGYLGINTVTEEYSDSIGLSSAQEWLDYYIERGLSWGPESEFKLLEVKDVKVDGLPGKMMVARSQSNLVNLAESHLIISRYVFMDGKGHFWFIAMITPAASDAGGDKDFSHLIKSIKIQN